jgi:hypothetical protein
MEKDKKLAENFKTRLIDIDGRRLNWFYQNRIKPVSSLTYPGFTSQLNGYAPISETVRDEISKYMSAS